MIIMHNEACYLFQHTFDTRSKTPEANAQNFKFRGVNFVHMSKRCSQNVDNEYMQVLNSKSNDTDLSLKLVTTKYELMHKIEALEKKVDEKNYQLEKKVKDNYIDKIDYRELVEKINSFTSQRRSRSNSRGPSTVPAGHMSRGRIEVCCT